jgi:hypothetical protein
MNTIIAMNGSITTPDEIVAKINDRKLSRLDLENASWSVETPQATLELTYEYHDGEVVDFEIDLIELDEYHDWSQVREWEVSVKYCFLRVGYSEWELDLDLDEEEDTKRPDSLSFDYWTDSESIEFGELWEYGDWEDVPNALEDIEDEDRQLKEDSAT